MMKSLFIQIKFENFRNLAKVIEKPTKLIFMADREITDIEQRVLPIDSFYF